MHLYIHIGNFAIPSYGLMIVLGILTANLIAIPMLKRYKLNGYDLIILEAYAFLGGFLGAKLLYFWVSRGDIDWSRILELDYFSQVMQGGFVFYGGLIGGIMAVLLAGRLHRIETARYIRYLIFLIPWVHGFGRIGCFMAGCCYGRPYEGACAVVFPEGAMAPAGISLFPIQLVEAVCLLMISIVILILQLKKNISYTLEIYIISYAILRFVLEYFRYDEARGGFLMFSTSQWISIILVVIGVWRVLKKNK